jgi:hypothetical protein
MRQFLKQKRSVYGLLLGILVCLLMVLFLKPTCLGPLFGIIIASTVADVSSPREGAVLGGFIPLPACIYAVYPTIKQSIELSTISNIYLLIIEVVLSSLLGLSFVIALGALIGLGMGKFLQSRKQGKATFF